MICLKDWREAIEARTVDRTGKKWVIIEIETLLKLVFECALLLHLERWTDGLYLALAEPLLSFCSMASYNNCHVSAADSEVNCE